MVSVYHHLPQSGCFLNHPQMSFLFHWFQKKNADLHTTIRKNIVGGPAIVFHRYHEQNKTLIREQHYGSEAKLCKAIYGFDANALLKCKISY